MSAQPSQDLGVDPVALQGRLGDQTDPTRIHHHNLVSHLPEEAGGPSRLTTAFDHDPAARLPPERSPKARFRRRDAPLTRHLALSVRPTKLALLLVKIDAKIVYVGLLSRQSCRLVSLPGRVPQQGRPTHLIWNLYLSPRITCNLFNVGATLNRCRLPLHKSVADDRGKVQRRGGALFGAVLRKY